MLTVAVAMLSICVSAQTTEFTYQGKLTDAMSTANGTYDFEFRLFSVASGGTAIGVLPRPGVVVANGVFTVNLDFGSGAFPGAARFLEIALKRPADPTFDTLIPRQSVTSSPYSQKSLSSAASDALSSNCVLCVTDGQIQSISGSKVSSAVANATSATTAGNVTGIVAIANGGTGSSTKNFVDLTTAQTIAGNKTFTGAQTVVGGTFYANLGQSGQSVHGGSGLSLTTANTAFTAIPGLSLTVGPHNGYAFVYFSTTGGIQVNSSTPTGFTIVDIAIFVDGVMVPNAGYRRYIVSNNSVLVSQIGNWSFSDVLFLETPSHVIDVRAAVVSPANSGAIVSGGSGSAMQATLSVAVLRSVSGP